MTDHNYTNGDYVVVVPVLIFFPFINHGHRLVVRTSIYFKQYGMILSVRNRNVILGKTKIKLMKKTFK